MTKKHSSEMIRLDQEFSPLVSIIINNYNYGKYVGKAIDSALSQTYHRIELIVVDDGSNDDSRERILAYGERIKAIFKSNGGQGSAYNAGFEASRGEIVMFLDADDALDRDVVTCVVDRFKDKDVSKVQFRLEIIDEESRPSGIYIPSGRMPSGYVLDMLLMYGGYGSPPASGNVYKRDMLNRIMPMTEADWRIAADSVPSLASPFFGKVSSLDKVLGYYRVHRGVAENQQNRSSLRPGNAASLSGKVQEFLKDEKLLQQLVAKHHKEKEVRVMETNPSALKTVLSFKILEPEHALNVRYTMKGLVLLGVKASIKYPLYSMSHKIGLAGWFLLVGICPSLLQKKLISLGLQPSVRNFTLQ